MNIDISEYIDFLWNGKSNTEKNKNVDIKNNTKDEEDLIKKYLKYKVKYLTLAGAQKKGSTKKMTKQEVEDKLTELRDKLFRCQKTAEQLPSKGKSSADRIKNSNIEDAKKKVPEISSEIDRLERILQVIVTKEKEEEEDAELERQAKVDAKAARDKDRDDMASRLKRQGELGIDLGDLTMNPNRDQTTKKEDYTYDDAGEGYYTKHDKRDKPKYRRDKGDTSEAELENPTKKSDWGDDSSVSNDSSESGLDATHTSTPAPLTPEQIEIIEKRVDELIEKNETSGLSEEELKELEYLQEQLSMSDF